MNFICFDLEGPLSPQDNAYELMKLFPNGDKIFEVISSYGDLLTLEEKEDYELGEIFETPPAPIDSVGLNSRAKRHHLWLS